jgi:hypothetical protein
VALPRDYVKNQKEGKLDFQVTPGNYRLVDNTVEWHFTDWKPTEDISISVERSGAYPLEDFELIMLLFNIMDFKTTYEGSARLYTEKDLKDFRAQGDVGLDRLYVRVLRNEIFARHGRLFHNDTMQSIFNNYSWYKPDPNYSDKMLNDFEKRNLRFIMRYERQRGWIK